jgi:hypothetical protein
LADRERNENPGEPAMDDDRQHISETEAKAGVTPHMTRYVLGFGLFLVIVIYLVILLVAG